MENDNTTINVRMKHNKPFDFYSLRAEDFKEVEEWITKNYLTSTSFKDRSRLIDSERKKYTQERSEIFLTELLRQLKDGLWTEMRDEALEWKEKEE